MWQHDYHSLVSDILAKKDIRSTRAGNTKSIFCSALIIPAEEFPILESRKIFYSGVVGELAAMLRGANTVQEFKDLGCHYWDSWGDSEGKLELDYGTAWRDFNGVDQLKELVEGLKHDPYGRRHIITGWRPDRLAKLSLPCCHLLYQWYVDCDGCLHMSWYQRSVDVMVGMPSDILFAYIWNMLIAKTVGLKHGSVTMFFGDTHIYENHFEQAKLLLNQFKVRYKEPSTNISYTFHSKSSYARVNLSDDATVFNFTPDMVTVENYNPSAAIKFKLNV